MYFRMLLVTDRRPPNNFLARRPITSNQLLSSFKLCSKQSDKDEEGRGEGGSMLQAGDSKEQKKRTKSLLFLEKIVHTLCLNSGKAP